MRLSCGRIRNFGRSDRIRTCGIDVPNVARYQLRHTPMILNFINSQLSAALPVVTKPLSSLPATRQSASHCHSFFLAYSPTGCARKRPQLRHTPMILNFINSQLSAALPVVTKPLSSLPATRQSASHCHSFFLAYSPIGCARKRPQLRHTPIF